MKSGIALILLMLAAAPAMAQTDPPIGSRLGQRDENAILRGSETRSVLTAHAFARCIIMKRRSAAAKFLNAASDAERRATDNVLSRDLGCASLDRETGGDFQRVSFPTDIYRGMLAEALIRNDTAFEALPALERQPSYARVWYAFTGRPGAVDEMATCVAETAPTEVRAVLAAEPESAGERIAMRGVAPALGPCLRVGATLTSNRQSLRAALAEAYYHRLYAPAEPAAAADVIVR